MKAKLPEPVHPRVLYSFCNSYEKISGIELIKILNSKINEIESISGGIKNNSGYKFIDYRAICWEDDKYKEGKYLFFVSGGAHFLDDNYKRISLENFGKRLREELESACKKLTGRNARNVNLDISIMVDSDVVSSEVEMFNPFEND